MANELITVRRLIADDAHALTFQTFGQYRTALLKAVDALAPSPAPQGDGAMANEATLFEHADGRYAVGTGSPAFRHDNPAWHRVGPVDVSALTAVADVAPDLEAIRHTLMTGLAHNAAIAALARLALTAPVATEQAQAVADEWRVGLFWSSANPGTKVKVIAEGTAQIAEYQTRDDFLHWLAASPEAAPAAMEGTGPAMQLNATQLRSALEFVAPDFDADEDQREAEVVLQRLPARTSTDGEPMEAGLYCWLAEYPEEGCIPLREDESFPAATPAAPRAETEGDCHG